MTSPRIGEEYRACHHAKPGQRHWWRSKGTWIALCPACHKLYAARKPVALGTMRIHDDDRPLTAPSSAPLTDAAEPEPSVDAMYGHLQTDGTVVWSSGLREPRLPPKKKP